MGTIMHVGNWAYLPVMDLLDTGKLKDIPILFLYGNGQDDWMWRNVVLCHDTVNETVPSNELKECYLEAILKNGNSNLSQS